MNKKKQEQKPLLILTSDKAFSSALDTSLCLTEYAVHKASTYAEALDLFETFSADIVFIDIENLAMHEMDLVYFIKARSPKTEIVILTTVNELDNATYSLHHGAAFYLMKPVSCADMHFIVEKLAAKITRTNEFLEAEHRVVEDLMAGSPAMQKALKLSMKIAPTTSTVLIGGESGTGKEFFAKIIHRMSRRLEGKFVAVNCGAIPDTLFESELFGHKKGAFTGADRDKAGLVEEAHMGTLFLDEIGELTPAAQVKLLHFLQEHSYRRVGDTTIRNVNVRIIAATNKDLADMVKQGTFREDLYYRLNVFYLYLAPLRDRRETIPNLIRLFVHRNNEKLDKNISSISKGAELVLAEYHYPGNVRELENILEHAMVLAEGSEITEKDLPEFMFKNRLRLTAPDKITPIPYHGDDTTADISPLAVVEKNHIQAALTRYNHNYSETAKKLGISRSTLWRKIKEYHLDTAFDLSTRKA